MKQTQDLGEFYLIERHTQRATTNDAASPPNAPRVTKYRTAYDIRNFNSERELEEALLKGSRHGGKLVPTRQIPIKLEFKLNKL